jgi:flagellar motor switch protein FliG
MVKSTIAALMMFVALVFQTGYAQAQQFVEEAGTLESLYESRARSVLNSFLRPHEYTIVVSADLDQDQKKLKDYQEKMELQFIPGLPIPMDPSLVPATNDLHSMKNKVTIDLVLNTDVSPEKEALLKTVLTSKLHLSEEAGDSIKISRAKLPDGMDEQPVQKPQVLPEFSWKTWGLIVLLALIALAGVVFWFNGRKNANAEEEQQKPRNEEFQAPPFKGDTSAKDQSAEEAEQERLLARELSDLKDQLLFIVAQYPQIAAKTVSEMLTEQHEEDVIRVFEHLSWDVSRRIFDGISPRTWARLGLKVKERDNQPTTQDYRDSMSRVYRSILSRFLEAGAEKDDANPFGFLFRLSHHEKKQLLSQEPASSFAMISLFAEGEDLSSVMEVVPAQVQNEMLMEIARLETLPESTLMSVANSLKERLKAMKAAPSIFANGPGLAAKILRSYSPEKEMEMYNRMKTEDPTSANAVRRIIAQFEDLTYYPSELVGSVMSLMDIEEISKSFFGVPTDIRGPVFGYLPPKRAKMIERDLETPGFNVSFSEMAAARRAFCLKLEQVLKSRGQTLEAVWQDIDSKMSQQQDQSLKLVS